jgi:phosphonate transport system permease protein
VNEHVSTRRKSVWLAMVMSAMLPGAGQLYCRETRRGTAITILFIAHLTIFFFTDLPYPAWLFWLCASLTWAWNVWAARLVAQEIETSTSLPIMVMVCLHVVTILIAAGESMPRLGPDKINVVSHIVGGLVHPDFITRRVEEQKALAKYAVPGPQAEAYRPLKPPAAGEPVMILTPITVAHRATITATGCRFAAHANGKLIVVGEDEAVVARFRTDSSGRFRASFANPRRLPGSYYVKAIVIKQTGGWTFSSTLRMTAPKMLETIYLALVGTVISVIFAVPMSFLGARNLMSGAKPLKLIYGLTRAVFTVLRSVEVLVIAVILVAIFDLGPVPGALALAIHGIGALGKLYSESIESIEQGPIEAIRSTGANELLVVIYGVVPQVVPQFIAFTLYRWDINVRMATVIGLVGGGGIGALLLEYMNLYQWREAATAIWLIAGVVMLMDYASAVIRERLV